jgi:stage III sporulation protein AG
VKKNFWQFMTMDKWMLVLTVGVLLFIVSTTAMTDVQGNTENTAQEDASVQTNEDLSLYQEKLEKRLVETLQKVEGVGEVEVMITLKSSSEQVVEKDESVETRMNGSENSSTEKQTTVLIDNGQSPYVVKEIMPQIEGVAIVAQGSEDAVVKSEIYEVVQALFNISIHKIKVLKGNF